MTDIVATVEGCGTQTQVLLAKVKEVLERIHDNVFPKKDPPKTLGALVDTFCAKEDPFLVYSRDQTRTRAAMAMTLAMAHGIQGDFEKATSSFPTGAGGEEVDLKPFSKRAKKWAKKLAEVLEKRAAERDAAERGVASKGAERSESAV